MYILPGYTMHYPRPDGLQQNGRACAKNTSPAVIIAVLGSFAPAGATRALPWTCKPLKRLDRNF